VEDAMSIAVVVEFKFKSGGRGPELLRSTMAERLPNVTRSYDGCEHIYLYADHDDPTHMFLLERWASREQYDTYREWAMVQPGTEELLPELERDMTTRYLFDTGA
jgi:quinol monooxygenase YgiN